MNKMKKKKINQHIVERVNKKGIKEKKINKQNGEKLKEIKKSKIQKNETCKDNKSFPEQRKDGAKEKGNKRKETHEATDKKRKKEKKDKEKKRIEDTREEHEIKDKKEKIEIKDKKEKIEIKDKKEKIEIKDKKEKIEIKDKKGKKKKKEKEGVARIISMNSRNTTGMFSFGTENTSIEKQIDARDDQMKKAQEEQKEKGSNSNKIEKEMKPIEKNKEFAENSENLSPLDFEKLIMSKKNSSVVWISYIAYYLEKNDLEQARNIAERALKTIDIHETNEKLNIYLCYLNMECAFGDKLDEIFKRALLVNDEKLVYLHLIRILKDNNKLMHLKEICEQCVRKFRHSKKVWKTYLEVLHGTFKDEEMAHEILLKALHSLPKRKHLHMIITAARLEYKYSNRERGKSYFERLIAEYPKRSDIWFTYLDIHINTLVKESDFKERKKLNTQELEFIRNIFERFSSIKYKPRVMKMIFTKWLSFEKSHGNKYNEQLVQKKAHEYVESLNIEE